MSEINKPTDNLVTMLEPDSIASEAFRSLRTNLSLRDFDSRVKTINVISSTAQEGKTTCALNLAYVYSQLKKKVLLIDMDLRLPSVHKKLRLKNKLGVTNVVARQASFEEAVIHYTEDLDVLLSGTKTPFASEFVQSNSLKTFLQGCADRYDIIIIDCPPINLVTDGMIVSTYVDGTILCVGSNKVEKKELAFVKEQLEQFDVHVLGIVMTRVPVNKKRYYNDYGYGYGYGYGHVSKQGKKKRK